MQKTIGFLGGGNMAQAMINGLLAGGHSAADIMVSDPNDAVRELLNGKGIKTTTDANALIDFADTLVLAIKPQLFESVLSPLCGKFGQTLIISVAAGITVDTIKRLTGSDLIIRAMPNTPALIQAGASGLYADSDIGDSSRQTAEAILKTTGLVIWVDSEDKIHAVTAVSGSAPAYFFYVMEAIIAKGVALGLTEEQAAQLTLQTAFGAGKMALHSSDTPAVLRKKVTSPNGTTQAAIENMQANRLDEMVAEAMQACADRSREMAEE